jgi:hypothetical protein
MTTQIKNIKDRIEDMNKHHQIEVLRILKKDKNIILNENSNGIFVNLTDLDQSIVNDLEKYINYVDKQLNNIETIENQKEILENTFFKKTASLVN